MSRTSDLLSLECCRCNWILLSSQHLNQITPPGRHRRRRRNWEKSATETGIRMTNWNRRPYGVYPLYTDMTTYPDNCFPSLPFWIKHYSNDSLFTGVSFFLKFPQFVSYSQSTKVNTLFVYRIHQCKAASFNRYLKTISHVFVLCS